MPAVYVILLGAYIYLGNHTAMPVKHLVAVLSSVTLVASILGFWHFHPAGPTPVRADTTAARTATSSSNCVDATGSPAIGTIPWSNPGNAAADDGATATAAITRNGGKTHYIECTNFGFTTTMIPTGSTINGIVVGITRQAASASTIQDLAVHIVQGGTIGSTDGSTTTYWPTALTNEVHGSATNLWGLSWTVSDITSSSFGATIAAQQAGNGGTVTASVDVMTITVSYTAPPTTYTQAAYRFFTNADSTDVGAPLAAANSPAILTAAGQAFRLRLLLGVATNPLSPPGVFTLQYAQQGADGQCDTAFSGETYSTLAVPVSVSGPPATVVNNTSVGTAAWGNPSNAAGAPDGTVATVVADTTGSNYLVATNLGFSIPANATITGIGVSVTRSATLPTFITDNAVRLVKAGAIGGTDRSNASTWPSSLGPQPYGGATDLWGNTWTPSDINSAAFGVAISAKSTWSSFSASVDGFSMTIYYTPWSPFLGYNNPTPSDGQTLTLHANDPSDGGRTIVAETYSETAATTTFVGPTAIPVGQDGEWDFSLFDNSAPPGTTYCFRVVKSDGSLLDSYSVIPQITTYSPAPTPTPTPSGPTNDQLMRHGAWFKDGVKQPMTF